MRRAAHRRRGASLGFVLMLAVTIFGLVLALVAPAFAATPANDGPVVERQAIPDGFTPMGEELVSGKPVQGTIAKKGDVAFYTFHAKANQWLTVEVRGSMGLRPQVEVLYPNDSLFTEIHGDIAATKTVQLTTGGIYSVQVKSYPSPSLTTGTYSMTVTITDRRP